MKATEPPKRGRGRPPRSATGPQVKKTLNFTPDEIAALTHKYGTVQAGVRVLVSRDMKNETDRQG